MDAAGDRVMGLICAPGDHKRRTSIGYTDAIGKIARHLHVMLDPADRWFGTCAVAALLAQTPSTKVSITQIEGGMVASAECGVLLNDQTPPPTSKRHC